LDTPNTSVILAHFWRPISLESTSEATRRSHASGEQGIEQAMMTPGTTAMKGHARHRRGPRMEQQAARLFGSCSQLSRPGKIEARMVSTVYPRATESLGQTSVTAAKVNVTSHVTLNVYRSQYAQAPCHFRHILTRRMPLQTFSEPLPPLVVPYTNCKYILDPSAADTDGCGWRHSTHPRRG
jgi:hypothetical protein